MDEYYWDEVYNQGWSDEKSETKFELIEEDFKGNEFFGTRIWLDKKTIGSLFDESVARRIR